MKIKKITKKLHKDPVKIYCFYQPFNNECIVVGKSDTFYKSFNSINFGFIFGRSAFSFKIDLEQNWSDKETRDYIKE